MIFGLDLGTFKTLREDVGMSQQKLADLAGITQGRLSAIEAGKGNPKLDTLNALCAALDAELILVPRRIGGNVRHMVDRHLNRHVAATSEVMSVRDELFIPDPEPGEE